MKEFFNKLRPKIERFAKESYSFLTSKVFLINFSGIIAMLSVFSFFTFLWMHYYTNHGESLQVHNYIGLSLEDAVQKAEQRSFSIIVNDSIFIVGKPPEEVLEQNPKPFSRVKENRKIYLTITKKQADLVSLPDLTGGNDDFKQYQRKLSRLSIDTKIVGRRFSNKLEPNTILELLYEGEDITEKVKDGFKVPMGSLVEAVVTERSGGTVSVPNLVCKNYDAARFLIGNYNLNIGSVIEDATVTDRNTAYIWRQSPMPAGRIRIGEQINIYLTQYLPDNCGNRKTRPSPKDFPTKPNTDDPKRKREDSQTNIEENESFGDEF
ncbi:MAG: PASTA domain-containing protein [Bacteroidota bacterium]